MKKLLVRAFAVITIFTVIAWLASLLTPYISPVHFWPMAFLALGFPYLAAVVFVFAVAWIFIHKKIGFCLLLLFFAGFENLSATLALHPSPNATFPKPANTLRILTWNVRGFDNPCNYADSFNAPRRRMLRYIARVNPDIMCFQEFTEYYVSGCYSNALELQNLGYRYYYKTNEIFHNYGYGPVISGTAIFSKIPILDSQRTLLGDSSYPEYLASVDVSLQNRKIRVFATHFKSMNLFAVPTQAQNRVIFYGDTDFVYHSTKFEKLRAFAQAHSRESLIAKAAVLKSPFPVVIGTDMNSVPASYQYHTMAAGLQDAFTVKGRGLGATMDSLPRTLRIDFLLVDKKLAIANFHKDELHLSDHFPQYIDVSWKE